MPGTVRIEKDAAVKIAEKRCGPDFRAYRASEGVPGNCTIEGSFPRGAGDVWCVLLDVYPKLSCSAAGSGRAIVIDKKTGEILYDGNAGDEG